MSTQGIALAALALSLLVAAWELWKFIEEGGRVRVTLLPAIGDKSSILTVTKLTEKRPERAMRFENELAVISVENGGRTAVTVSDVTFDLGRHSRWRRGRHSVGLPPLDWHDGCTDRRVRLEPFDSQQFIFDASHLLTAVMGEDTTWPLDVRATVRVAGMRRARRSPWGRRWHFEKGSRPVLWASEPFDLAQQLHNFVSWRVRGAGEGRAELMLADLAMKLAERLEAGEKLDRDEIEKMIDDAFREDAVDVGAGYLALAIHQELEAPSGGLLDGSSFAEHRPARGAANARTETQTAPPSWTSTGEST